MSQTMQREDWEHLTGGLRRLYGELDREKHAQVMLEVLNELVPADPLALQSANVHTPMAMSARMFPANLSTPEQFGLIAQYSHQSPFAAYFLATWDAQWKMITDFMPLEEFQKTDLYRLALQPLGVRYQILSVLGVCDETGYCIVMNRKEQAFTEREREILNTLHPHLVNSWLNAVMHARVQNSLAAVQAAMEAAPGAFGCFNSEGKITWLQAKAATWLNDFFEDEIKTADNLPNGVRQLLETARQTGDIPKPLEKIHGSERLTVCMGNSPVGGWVMRLERKPAEVPAHFQPLPQFSPRKNDVLRWLVEGKRDSEIAVILNLSVRTVQKHVHDILCEFKVENRATAIVRAIEYCAASRQAEALHPATPG